MPLKLILCRLIPLTALVFSLILSVTNVVAQSKDLTYPNRQITLIIPFPPAGATAVSYTHLTLPTIYSV